MTLDERIDKLLERVSDVVSAWHDGNTVDTTSELNVVLGMSMDTYDAYINRPREWARRVISSSRYDQIMQQLSDSIKR